ncbi:response regulator transcription factor [Streptacidiphilus monticola]
MSPRDLQEAIDAGLAELAGSGVRFRHPLMRSAIYARASLLERIQSHTALAEQLAAHPDRQLWHRAAAALGADEEIAAELENYALRSERRGTVMAATAALRKAADLTSDADRRTSLVLQAAELTGEIGARREAAALLERTDLSTLGPVDRARLTNVVEIIDFSRFHDADARVRELTAAAGGPLAAGHVQSAVTLLWRAARRCFFQVPGAVARQALIDRLQAVQLPEDDPRGLAIRAYADPEHHGRAVLDQLSRAVPDRTSVDSMYLLGAAALVLGDFRRSAADMDAAADLCRRQGRLGQLPRILIGGGWSRIWLGEWDKALAEAEEGAGLARETGEEFYTLSAQANIAAVCALRGDVDRARTLAAHVQGHPLSAGMSYLHSGAQQSSALATLLGGEAEQAHAMLLRLFDPTEPVHHPVMQWWAVPELVDAAVSADRVEQTRPLLEPLPALAERCGSPMLRMTAQYAAAVLADEPEADELYRVAMKGDVGAWPLYRARLDLHHGRRLRRLRQVQASREPLRAARDAFDFLGAHPWAESARRELRAAGETSGRPETSVRELLSAQELQIATLAAQGLTNRQIGERLFLSHRTVGAHLYRIFPKLGVAARAQLGAALQQAQRS